MKIVITESARLIVIDNIPVPEIKQGEIYRFKGLLLKCLEVISIEKNWERSLFLLPNGEEKIYFHSQLV